MATGKVTLPLLSCFQRLLDLLEEDEDIPILAPGTIREITYRLLIGDQGERLRQIASVFSQGHQIARIIDWLKNNYTASLRIEDLAKQVSMSASSFLTISNPTHRDDPVAVPENVAVERSAQDNAYRTGRCLDSGLSCWLRKRITIQPGISSVIRRATSTGYQEIARDTCRGKSVGNEQFLHLIQIVYARFTFAIVPTKHLTRTMGSLNFKVNQQ